MVVLLIIASPVFDGTKLYNEFVEAQSTVEAGKYYFGQPVCEMTFAGDINGDCKVNFLDFRIMALHWLQENQ